MRAGFAIGITEDNASLLWSPQAPDARTAMPPRGTALEGVTQAREELTALHPTYTRLLIDWAALQPDPHRPPALEQQNAGCARTIGPCLPYGGVREEFAALASQQSHGGGFSVVLDIYGTPAWAARPPSGCERPRAGPSARALTNVGITAYRRLIHALAGLGSRDGVALQWWAPWNEPNDPTFLEPQRPFCQPRAPARSPTAYAELARAMADQLRAEGGERHLLLGELNAYERGTSDRVSVAQFIAGLPADVLCLSDVWSLHAYAARSPFAPSRDPVAVLEQALDQRGGCGREAHVWVTEAGAGAPHPGDRWRAAPDEQRAACVALSHQLMDWARDPRVAAVFQYSFRDDPAFPVGLVDASLKTARPAYDLWLAWTQSRAAGRPAAAEAACAEAPVQQALAAASRHP